MKPESSENPASKEQLSPQSLSAEPIQILGGVKNPGAVPYQEGADLSFYLSKTGAAPSAEDDAKIQIIRGEPGKKKAQEFNLKDGSIPPLKSGDIVIVHPPAQKTFIEKTIAVAASAAAILGTAALLVLVV
jgi:protein involved in polysaccharide export with SLBB domain